MKKEEINEAKHIARGAGMPRGLKLHFSTSR